MVLSNRHTFNIQKFSDQDNTYNLLYIVVVHSRSEWPDEDLYKCHSSSIFANVDSKF